MKMIRTVRLIYFTYLIITISVINIFIQITGPSSTISIYENPLNASFLNQHPSLKNFNTQKIRSPHFKDIAYQARNYSKLDFWTDTSLEEFMQVEKNIFPFLNERIINLKRRFRGKGYVLPLCDRYFDFGYHLIRGIRDYYKSTYPIEIFTINKEELSTEHRSLLMRYDNITIIHINELIDNDYAQLKTWSVKPFALLYSSFEEALLLDADVVFLNNPDRMFDHPEYIKNGAYFFRDRSLGYLGKENYVKSWLDAILPTLSDRVLNSRIYNQKSYFELETGVLMVNKAQHLFSILLASRMNCVTERKIVYDKVYGDKETYWIGMEMMEYPYYVSPYPVGLIGYTKTEEPVGVCSSNIFHLLDGKPFWMNGGLVKGKYDDEVLSTLQNFTDWAIEGHHFFLEHDDCIVESEIKKLIGNERKNLDAMIELWYQNPSSSSSRIVLGILALILILIF